MRRVWPAGPRPLAGAEAEHAAKQQQVSLVDRAQVANDDNRAVVLVLAGQSNTNTQGKTIFEEHFLERPLAEKLVHRRDGDRRSQRLNGVHALGLDPSALSDIDVGCFAHGVVQ